MKNREERAANAKLHYKLMMEKYEDDIQKAQANSKIYSEDYVFQQINRQRCEDAEIVLEGTDTVTSIFRHYRKSNMCVLNFASYKHPGGGFMTGSRAQEEDLCHHSTLYPVLENFREFYDYNIRHTNGGLYLNRAIYSKGIKFFQGNKFAIVDVITCAAPNLSAFRGEKSENSGTLESRIRFIVNICKEMDVKVLIAGAFGCGVFKQDPQEVCKIFLDQIKASDMEKVIFAIPPGANLDAFERAIEK